MKTVSFIGGGNMASAIISGICKAGLEVSLKVYDPDEGKLEVLRDRYGVIAESSERAAAAGADYLVLAVKPQNFPEVLAALKENVSEKTVLVSIAAGITESYIINSLAYPAKVVLVMPNTPLLLGCGATALAKGTTVLEEEFAFVRRMFDSAGITAVIPPDRMNEVIPLNGSAPAFIYLFAQYFVEYGREQGFPEEVCLSLFAQALAGSAKMLTESGHSVEKLIEMVSSKGGTTIAGLEALKENHLEKAVRSACESCVQRAYELTK